MAERHAAKAGRSKKRANAPCGRAAALTAGAVGAAQAAGPGVRKRKWDGEEESRHEGTRHSGPRSMPEFHRRPAYSVISRKRATSWRKRDAPFVASSPDRMRAKLQLCWTRSFSAV